MAEQERARRRSRPSRDKNPVNPQLQNESNVLVENPEKDEPVTETANETSEESTEEVDARLSRELETRESVRREMIFADTPMMPVPTPRDGLEYRYVRVESYGKVDNVNWSQANRKGWDACDPRSMPEMQHVIPDRESPFPDKIVIGGLMLCQRAAEIGIELQKRNEAKTRQQIEALESSYLNDGGNNSSMKKFTDNRSSIKFGD